MKNWDAAIRDYDAALAINPRPDTSLYGRGLVKRLKGDTRGAAADIVAATAVTPDIAARFAKLTFVAAAGN
jgi:hypothetical protein